jgi:hypothetical protein
MRTATLTVALLSLVATTSLRAQEASREDFREYCQVQQGRWIGDVTWVADWPGFGKKGDKVVAYFEANMAEDDNAMTMRFFGGQGSATGLCYYDSRAKRIRLLWALSSGASIQVIAYKKDGQWVQESSNSLPDGRLAESIDQLTVSDNGNTHTVTGRGKLDDESTDDHYAVWRRVSEPAKK